MHADEAFPNAADNSQLDPMALVQQLFSTDAWASTPQYAAPFEEVSEQEKELVASLDGMASSKENASANLFADYGQLTVLFSWTISRDGYNPVIFNAMSALLRLCQRADDKEPKYKDDIAAESVISSTTSTRLPNLSAAQIRHCAQLAIALLCVAEEPWPDHGRRDVQRPVQPGTWAASELSVCEPAHICVSTLVRLIHSRYIACKGHGWELQDILDKCQMNALPHSPGHSYCSSRHFPPMVKLAFARSWTQNVVLEPGTDAACALDLLKFLCKKDRYYLKPSPCIVIA
jgi:hypothetical protein